MKALDTLFTRLGIGPTLAMLIKVGIPLLLLAGAALVAWIIARRKRKAAPPPSVTATATQPMLDTQKLRKAFLRFAAQLPADYRRSLLNFEQFVVLGPAGSGKSRVIDGVTDWKRRTKEFVASQAVDPDLQIFLTSTAVITELPATILDDHSDRCRTALQHLWKPLYKSRAPTIVVVIDAVRLAASTGDAIRDLAETIRSKVNVIAQIRKAPVEVRVVLTHLDQLEGYADFVDLSTTTALPTRIPIAPYGEKANIRADLDAWVDGLRGHLPRALTTLPSDAFRRLVVFFHRLPDFTPTLALFLEALYAHEPLAPDPVPGGVFLVGETPTVSNPLKGAAEIGPGPDPRRRHLLAAGLVGAAGVLYLAVAYVNQQALWQKAHDELAEYSPTTYGTEREARRREAITTFTYRTHGVLLRFPDFFSGARQKMRKTFADSVRDELLVPRLRQFGTKGRTDDGGIALPQRRSLYMLALIHSDHDDRMRILDPKRLYIWSSMTGLTSDLIRDYLSDVDVPVNRPVDFDMAEHEIDKADSTSSWVLFFHKTQEALADGVVELGELRDLRIRASSLTKALDRFDHDDVTRNILDELDDAAGVGDKTGGGRLKLAYLPKYADFLQNISSSDVLGQRDALRRILRAVETTAIDSNGVVLLRNLIDRLALLYATDERVEGEDAVRVTLAGQEYVFDLKKWAMAIRDSGAAEEISLFVRQDSATSSVFFTSSDDDMRPVVWNPTNDGSVLFTGRGTIEGRYTHPAYDKYVRMPVKKLAEILEKKSIPDDRKRQVREFVREQVRRYATEYRRQLATFYRSFGIAATSPEALRVVLSQMVSDASPFNDFLTAVDRQVTVDADDPNLDAMDDVATEYAAWHNAVSPGSGAPEIAKYKAILAQLLADLGPPPEATSAAPAATVIAAAEPPTTTGQTLEKALSPAGRLVLSNLRGDSGAYGNLVVAWVSSIKLPDYQRVPFLAPIVSLGTIGRKDVERVVAAAWERDMIPDIQHIADRFPFQKDAKEDVAPQEITAVLHPQTGKLFDMYRRFLEPITDVDGAGYRLKRQLRGSITVPAGMFTTLTQAGMLATRLWDASGRPLPLEVRIATVPFEHGPDPRLALTLTYMNAGETPVMNFNQKPTEKTVHFDWTREQASQVGMQLTDLDSKESAFPEPLVIAPSFWSLHKLLRIGTASAVKFPPDATLYAWELKVKKGRNETSRVRFVVLGDPFLPFQLARGAATTPSRSARLQRTVGQAGTSTEENAR